MKRPWDPSDPFTVVSPCHVFIIAIGPRYMIVSNNTICMKVDFVVAHAPHSWDMSMDDDSEQQSIRFWKPVSEVSAKRTVPRLPLSFVGDAHVELSH